MAAIDLSIIIVNYNAKNFLHKCLTSIFNTLTQISYEIIVVDNNSSDNTVEFIRHEFPSIKMIANKENIGYAKANNQGIKIAKSDLILLLNPDTVVFEGSIEKMVNYIKNNSDVGIVGCRVINFGSGLQWDSCGTFLTPLNLCLKELGLEKFFLNHRFFGQRLMYFWKRNSSQQVDWVSGVSMLLKKKVIEDVGALDESYFAYLEDMDYCRRAANRSWKTFFLHSAEIFHNAGASWKQRSDIHLFTSLTSEKKYFKKYYGTIGLHIFKFLHLLGSYEKFFINLLLKDRHKAKDHYKILQWIISGRI